MKMVVPSVNGGVWVAGWREIVLFLAKLAIIINSLNFMCVLLWLTLPYTRFVLS